MDDEPFYGPEVRTRCLLKFMVSHPQVKWDQTKKRGRGGRVVGFTEDGRKLNQLGTGIVMWASKIYDLMGYGR